MQRTEVQTQVLSLLVEPEASRPLSFLAAVVQSSCRVLTAVVYDLCAVCDWVFAGGDGQLGLLLTAVMGLMFPAVLQATHTERNGHSWELQLSRFSSFAHALRLLLLPCTSSSSRRTRTSPRRTTG